jgi:hypothetical protein
VSSVATDSTTGRNPEAIFGFLVAMMFAAWVFPMVAAAIKDGVTPIDFVGILMLGGPNCCLGGLILLILPFLPPSKRKKDEIVLDSESE